LRHWKSALDQIYYHNAYKIPANYKPKSETERALQESLRDLELQCKERVDLLNAIQQSKKSDKKSNIVQRVVSGGSTGGESFIAGGSVPAFDYEALSRPQYQIQSATSRPQPVTTASTLSIRDRVTPQMLEEAQRESDRKAAQAALTNTNTHTNMPRSREESPEKKQGFFKSTLRAGKDSKLAMTMRGARPAVVSTQAATVAWPSAQTTEAPRSREVSRQASMEYTRLEQPVTSNIGRKHNYIRQNDFTNEDVRRAASMDLPARPRSHEPTLRDGGAPRGTAVDTLVRRSQDLGARGNMGPPPRPQPKLNTNTGAMRQEPTSAPTSPPLPNLQYRSEYGSNDLDQRNMQMLKSRKARMELDATKAASATQSQPQSPSKLRQALRMVPRKPVASSPAPQPPAPNMIYVKAPAKPPPTKEQVRPPSQTTSRGGIEAQQAKKVVRPKQSNMPVGSRPAGAASAPKPKQLVLADGVESDDDSDEGLPGADAEWDQRVKYIMKHLPKGVDKDAAKSILNEIVVKGDEVHWEDIAGLDIAKNALKEAVVYPFLRPDLFMGLREPARGMLLFGPPGTGKTMLARAVATESKSTFFAISASSLTSKFLGESEKLVRALFSLAKMLTPAIIFVDEIDSLLSSRGGGSEHEATRRIKTEFLIQWSDLASAAAGKQPTEGDASRVLVLAATNLPWAIDEAARRRFVRRQYIPLPENHVREYQLTKLMGHQKHSLRDRDFKRLVVLTDGKRD